MLPRNPVKSQIGKNYLETFVKRGTFEKYIKSLKSICERVYILV